MQRKRSKIIIDLIMNKIDVLQAIQSLRFMLEDANNEEIKNWVENEINGYSSEELIPHYRKASAMLMGTIQVGYAIYPNINIPITDTEAFKFFNTVGITEPISIIMQYAKAENETEDHSLCLDANLVLVNQFKKTNGNVIKAHRKLGIYTYNNILATIKDKLLEIFKELEINYGNLDELYIDFSDAKKRDDVLEKIKLIVYNDNSIHIGNDNKIENTNIGNDNEIGNDNMGEKNEN